METEKVRPLEHKQIQRRPRDCKLADYCDLNEIAHDDLRGCLDRFEAALSFRYIRALIRIESDNKEDDEEEDAKLRRRGCLDLPPRRARLARPARRAGLAIPGPAAAAAEALVERFDIEPISDFSAK